MLQHCFSFISLLTHSKYFHLNDNALLRIIFETLKLDLRKSIMYY